MLEPNPPLKGMETLIARHFINDIRKQRSFADDGKSVKSTPADRRGRQHEDGVMAYNGLAGRMGKESYLIRQAVA